ncbi:acyl-CoA dehydrogenase family protein [Nocardia goodfellowii]|uniref:Alkylation response protein AidB-like acyl-CoA dehydrogenase n=1 Tax=Nocardia goodfellowii TaxID=882446 RepID=A0ABS4QLJ7_9NOCA|nr:acyl-CoA dehydrogenase family protein [Nocardia goodfellowii]MBP2192020.1 alkylation response protein AidB-like acyl-CoA dehydrogenase [Nocardia goodfellowii]
MTETASANPDFAALHAELRAVARNVLARTGSGGSVDRALAARQGWLGLEVPAEFDGAGATFAESAVVAREWGRAVARGSYPSAVLAAGTCLLLAPEPGRDRLLRALAAGESTAAVAFTSDAGAARPTAAPFRLRLRGGQRTLSGSAEFVLDAPAADRLLLFATDTDGLPVVVSVAARTAGISRTAQPLLDRTRTFGCLVAEDLRVSPDSIHRFTGDPASALRRVHDRAAVAVACDSLGLSEAVLAATVAYATTRTQFGRPIGAFQAVKHACADMLVRLRVSRHLVDAAVRQVAEPGPDAEVAVAMAKAHACAAAVDIAGKALQLHGGYGYTWESGIHRYLERATLNRVLYGAPAAHRRRISTRYGLGKDHRA